MIRKPNGTIIIKEFSGIYDFEGGEIPSSKYTEQTIVEYDANVLSSDKIQISLDGEESHTLTEGESVIITTEDDFPELNEVAIVGNNNKLKLGNLLNASSGTCKIKSELKKYLLNNLAVGKYYIYPNNELLIIRNSWCDPYISYPVLTTHFQDFKNMTDAKLKKINDEALDEVYDDLIGFDNVYDAIWFTEIKQLKIAKMLSMFSNNFQQIDPNKNFKEIYDKKLESVIIKYKLSENAKTGAVESAVPNTQTSGRIGF